MRGRGWTQSIHAIPGKGYEVFAPEWNAATGIAGTPEAPAALFVYETSSTDAGYVGLYPDSVKLLWVGEYQIRVIDGCGPTGLGSAGTLEVSGADIYEVVEVQSRLSG